MSSAMTAAMAKVRKAELRASAASDKGAACFASLHSTGRGQRRERGLCAAQHQPPRRLETSAVGADGA
jgi:hypothetical protein